MNTKQFFQARNIALKNATPSIYSSVELDAWSRNFDYAGYVDLHNKCKVTGAKLSAEGWKAFCDLMFLEMMVYFADKHENEASNETL